MTDKRIVKFDNELHIEAYQFEGILQKFPNHFHEYYVIGFINSGRRKLSSKNVEYIISTGDLVIFNPLENHTCSQLDNEPMDYRCLNISTDIMQEIVWDITGKEFLPQFRLTIVKNQEILALLKELHQRIMEETTDFDKEEAFYLLIAQLLSSFESSTAPKPLIGDEIQQTSQFMEAHFAEKITLNDLSRLAGLNKYTLIRTFTKQLGVSPYQYLTAVRISESKKLLELGIEPIDAAFRTGFSDQSHFSKFFKNFIGLTPKQYQNIFREECI